MCTINFNINRSSKVDSKLVGPPSVVPIPPHPPQVNMILRFMSSINQIAIVFLGHAEGGGIIEICIAVVDGNFIPVFILCTSIYYHLLPLDEFLANFREL